MADELTERDKYRSMWDRPEYRERSPGLRRAENAHAWLGCSAGESLCDYGAGTGRASAWFAARGLDVTAFDIAPNAVQEFDGRVVIGSLWMMPEFGSFDYGFCCDVMEHIPPEHVPACISGIARRTRKAAFFEIALFDCHMGEVIGEHLHLCVKPPKWWESALRKGFGKVEIVNEAKYVLARCEP